MKIYKSPNKEQWDEIVLRPPADISLMEKKVRKILANVKEKGDKAIRKYTEAFDGIKLKELLVSDDEIDKAGLFISEELKKAIKQAKENIEKFHAVQTETANRIETMPGVVCWRRTVAIEKIGLYIPGGSAPLFSTVLMLGVPAQLSGCREIILCTPPDKDGTVHPAILYTAKLCGISKIFKVGGAQAIAAMAYGTKSIPRVLKIFGPGNAWVTTAKQLIQQGGVAIDMPAGPSEVLVIADETAIPSFVAADLLSQAEHGPGSQVILLSTRESIVQKVMVELEKQTKKLSRKDMIMEVLKNSRAILFKNIDEAIIFSNLYAPEHLILAVDRAEHYAEQVVNAGSVFLGNYSPESAGDYASGTNHVLPTQGFAAAFSGVSLESFTKKISYQHLTKEGLSNIAVTVTTMATAETLDAHSKAVTIRLK